MITRSDRRVPSFYKALSFVDGKPLCNKTAGLMNSLLKIGFRTGADSGQVTDVHTARVEGNLRVAGQIYLFV